MFTDRFPHHANSVPALYGEKSAADFFFQRIHGILAHPGQCFFHILLRPDIAVFGTSLNCLSVSAPVPLSALVQHHHRLSRTQPEFFRLSAFLKTSPAEFFQWSGNHTDNLLHKLSSSLPDFIYMYRPGEI